MLIELPKDNAEGPDIPGKRKIVVRRQPYDEYYSILLPSGNEEYVPPDKAERILRVNGIKDPDKILTNTWNFYVSICYVDEPTNSPSAGK